MLNSKVVDNALTAFPEFKDQILGVAREAVARLDLKQKRATPPVDEPEPA